jgi:hypothetical protein
MDIIQKYDSYIVINEIYSLLYPKASAEILSTIDLKVFWQLCIIFRITGFLYFVHRQVVLVFYSTNLTEYRIMYKAQKQ